MLLTAVLVDCLRTQYIIRVCSTNLLRFCNHAPKSPIGSLPPRGLTPLLRFTPEICNLIFRLALYAYPDKARGYYPGSAYYFRPEYEHYQRIDTALLLTCHRIYDETHLLPVIEKEHVFWWGAGTATRLGRVRIQRILP